MEEYLKAVACVLIALVLGITLSKQNKDMTLVLSMTVCCMVMGLVMMYLQPVLDLITGMQQLGQLDESMVRILLKACGIGLIGQIATLICNDAGNAALGKALQVLASVLVLWLSVPLFEGLLDLLQKIVGEL